MKPYLRGGALHSEGDEPHSVLGVVADQDTNEVLSVEEFDPKLNTWGAPKFDDAVALLQTDFELDKEFEFSRKAA